MGDKAQVVKWVVADVANFSPSEKFDLWHDRAAFHFFTDDTEVVKYTHKIGPALKNDGIAVIGTFSENGPKKCSGIVIKQYSEEGLAKVFEKEFKKVKCVNVDHPTPFNTTQNFTFCSFQRSVN